MNERLEPRDCAMRLRTFELVVYIDHDGREQIDWQWTGDPATGMAALGYLHAAILGMYHGQLHARDDDDYTRPPK